MIQLGNFIAICISIIIYIIWSFFSIMDYKHCKNTYNSVEALTFLYISLHIVIIFGCIMYFIIIPGFIYLNQYTIP